MLEGDWLSLKPRGRTTRVQITLRVESGDPRLSPREIAHALARTHSFIAEELTGLVTYGARRLVLKPRIRVTRIVVR